MEQGLIFLFFVAVFAIIVGGIIYSFYAAKKRREAFAALAARLGLSFAPHNDSTLAARLEFLDKLRRGSNRYTFNTLRGQYKEHEVIVFDYHYETHSTNSKGQRSTQHHYLSCFVLILPASFPELTIGAEGFFSKIAQAIGYDDIDFESHEFSRQFCVRSGDKKFAYGVCNSSMIEYLLANSDLAIEIEGNCLAIVFDSRLAAEQIHYNLDRLIQVRSRLPEYLFDGR